MTIPRNNISQHITNRIAIHRIPDREIQMINIIGDIELRGTRDNSPANLFHQGFRANLTSNSNTRTIFKHHQTRLCAVIQNRQTTIVRTQIGRTSPYQLITSIRWNRIHVSPSVTFTHETTVIESEFPVNLIKHDEISLLSPHISIRSQFTIRHIIPKTERTQITTIITTPYIRLKRRFSRSIRSRVNGKQLSPGNFKKILSFLESASVRICSPKRNRRGHKLRLINKPIPLIFILRRPSSNPLVRPCR